MSAQPGAEDVCVDDDRAACDGRHLLMAAMNASHSSSVRSGIAVSSSGGAGRARRSNSSRGSSSEGSILIGFVGSDVVTTSGTTPVYGLMTPRSSGPVATERAFASSHGASAD
jgi:hypothetical protein